MTDAALRTPEQHEAIAKAIAEREHATVTRTRFANIKEATSLDAVCNDYPQVARLRSAALAEAETLELLSDGLSGLFASKARMLLECAERLREACK